MKTALEIIENKCNSGSTRRVMTPQDIVDVMVEYAEQALDEASKKARTIRISNSGCFYDASVDRESILNIKQQLK